MKRGLVILFMLMLIPAVYASIDINVEPSKMNLGDILDISGTITESFSSFAVLEVALKCGEDSTPILTRSVSLTSGEDYTFSEDFKVTSEGGCNVEGKLIKDSQTVSTGTSNTFIVTKDLVGSFSIAQEFLHLGDELIAEGTVTRLNGESFDGFGNLYLLNEGAVAFVDTINIKNGVLKYVKSTDGMPSGSYTVNVDITDQYGNKDEFETGTVQILGGLKVTGEFQQATFKPGESVKLEGAVLKSDDRNAKSGIVRAGFDENLYEAKFSKGYYKVIFDVPSNIRSGDHLVEVNAIDENGNTGSISITLKVTAVPTRLALSLGGSSLEPGGVLSIDSSVFDQAGDDLPTYVTIEVYDAKGKRLFSDKVHTGEDLDLGLTADAAPGDWEVILSLDDLEEVINFEVKEKIDLAISLEGQTLYVTNKGNVDVNDELSISFSGPLETTRNERLKLGIDKTTSFNLGVGVVSGFYDVAVNGEEFMQVSITKKSNYLKFFMYIVGIAVLLLLVHMSRSFLKFGRKKNYQSREREKGQGTLRQIVEKKKYEEIRRQKDKKRPFAEGVKEFRERILANVRKEEREETKKKFMDEFLKKK